MYIFSGCYTRVSERYEYSDESIEAMHLDDFEYYLDLGIAAGSLDCKLHKARNLLYSDLVAHDPKEAHRMFIALLLVINWITWLGWCLPSLSTIKLLFFPL